MKKSILTLVGIIILASYANASFGQSEASTAPEPGSRVFLDYKNGFKDIKLGSDIADISSKTTLVDKNSHYYSYKDVAGLKIGNSEITSITLVGFNGKIKDIFISLHKGTGGSVYSVLREAYGIYSDKPNRYMDKYYWIGSKVKLIVDYTSEYKEPTVWFSDISLSELYYKSLKEKDKKAIDDL